MSKVCDKCNRPTQDMYNKMPLCPPCKEQVKAHREKRKKGEVS